MKALFRPLLKLDLMMSTIAFDFPLAESIMRPHEMFPFFSPQDFFKYIHDDH